MTVAVDAMGGDDAPSIVVAGAVAAARAGVPVTLVGREDAIHRELERLSDRPAIVRIEPTPDVVGMDEPAATPLRRKPASSIARCAELVREGGAEAMVSAGNTGATMAAATVLVGTIEGVDRPALAATIPTRTGHTLVLDVGANMSTRPALLRQFAVMGHSYVVEVHGKSDPRVGLLSVGHEEGKGTETTREGHKVLQAAGLNFVGNVEGHDVFRGSVDVVVCDGFVGNVLLKASEELAHWMVDRMVHDVAEAVGSPEVADELAAGLHRRVDFNEYGGAPLLGIAAGCFVAHGRSSARGIERSIRGAADFCEKRVHDKIRSRMAVMHEREVAMMPEEER